MCAHHVQQRVSCRVRVAARGVVLERSLGRGPARAQGVDQARGVGVAGHARSHALRSFEDVRRAGQAVGRQVSGGQASGRGVRGVQLFGIGGVTQKLPQSRGLRAGAAECVQHHFGRQAQQPPHRGRRSHRARGAGGVEHLVVRAAQKFADTDADFVAGHAGHQQIAPAGAQRLRHRQRGREDHRRRVEDRAVVHVVLFGEMRGRGVDRRGHHRAAAAAVDQHLAGTVGGPLRQPEARQRFDRSRALAGQRRGKPVEEQVFGAAQHRRGNVRVLQRGGKVRKLAARVGVVQRVVHRVVRTAVLGVVQTAPLACSAAISSAV